MEGIGKDVFEEWMKRLMERIDRLDSIISVLINKEAAGVKYMDGERLYDNQDLCEMLRTSKRSLQRFRSEYGLRYQKISRKTYYKESDVLEFISRNMEEVTLDGEKALTYVRSRHHIDDQTNIARMARQRQFLAALEEKLRQQDSQFAAEAYTALEDYMVTDIASGTAAKIGEKLKQYKQLDTLTIDGENVIENGYWAYHLDESSREATVLQLFYEKVR